MNTPKKNSKSPKAPAKPARAGRPTSYSKELADEFLRRMMSGKTLRKTCKDEDMPSAPTVRLWVLNNVDGFSKRYEEARRLLAEHWADEIVDISDDATNDFIETPDGKERVNTDHIQRSRLRVDTRKWLLGRIVPNIYGDKVDLNHGVQPKNPLTKLLEQVQGTPFRPKSDE